MAKMFRHLEPSLLVAHPATKPKPTPPAVAPTSHLEAIGREVGTLATSPDKRVSGPIVKGITRALSAHQKLIGSAEYKKQAPRQKLQTLRAMKSAEIMDANATHQQACAMKRDEIPANMRSRMNPKSK